MYKRFVAAWLGLVLAIFLVTPGLSQQATAPQYQTAADIPYEIFAQLPKIEDVSLSPNGRFLAVIFPIDGDAKLTIFDLSVDSPEPPRVVNTGDVEVNWVQWVNDNRLVLNYSIFIEIDKDERVPQQRLMAFNRDGSEAIRIGKPGPGSKTNQESILNWLHDDPDHILMQFNTIFGRDLGVYKLNVNNGGLDIVKNPEDGSYFWFADKDGELRLGWGYYKKHFTVFTRPKGERKWRSFPDHKLFREEEFEPLTFGLDGNTLLVKMGHETNTEAIYEFNLDTATLGDMVYVNPDYDIDGVVVSGGTGEIMALSYTDDFQELHFFNDEFEKMLGLLERALPGMKIAILDTTPDGRFHVVRSYSSSDPGMLYTYDSEEKQLSPIWEVMDYLPPELMSEVIKVTYQARDGLEIFGYLTIPKESDGKNLPTVLLVHGGPWSRDNMEFDAEVQFLASRGYAVFQPNFRGSTGFGKEYEELGYGKWRTDMQYDLVDAVNWLVAEGLTDPSRVCIAGGSYGGYAALLGVALYPDMYKCAFAFAPVTDIYYLMQTRRGTDSYDFYKDSVTLGLKPGQYDYLSPLEYVDKIQAPVLIIHGDEDKIADIKHSEKMAKALRKKKKQYKFIVLEGAPHGIPEEKDRFIYFGELEKFLAENLGN